MLFSSSTHRPSDGDSQHRARYLPRELSLPHFEAIGVKITPTENSGRSRPLITNALSVTG